MAEESRVLIVDDEPDIREIVGLMLEDAGYKVFSLPSGEGLVDMVRDEGIDLVILDLGLPGADGLTLTRELKAQSDVGVVILSGRAETTEKIIGLEVGADDYLAKPFEPRELLARVRSVLRRLAAMPKTEVGQSDVPTEIQRYTFRDWQFDVLSRTLTSPDGDTVTLSSGEFNLLKALVEHPNRVLSRDQLLDFTHGMDTPAFDRSVDVQVVRLRKKIEPNPQKPEFIKTVRNAGYIFATKVERS
ncbi:MAG: response regulator [Rhodospirillaceae bacterium]|jgi:two-component system, OmpR family, response regulator|nr:response regulator [Rhodospirillaceae bacterium]